MPGPSTRAAGLLLAGLPIVCVLVVSLPEVLRDRIFPFDSALIAANGALFASLFADLGAFVSAPLDWLWAYYDQYPALSVRRHPPLFGFVAGLIYSVTGVSAMSAKLTVMLFGLVFASGFFFVAQRLLSSALLASLATLLIVVTPQFAIHFRSVWLDVPSLAFAIWAFYFYLARLDGDRSFKTVLGMVGAAVLALYTYQPTIVLLSGIVVYLLVNELRTFFRDPPLLIGTGLLVVLMLPLIAFTLLLAPDNLSVTTGEIPDAWKEFASPTYASWMVTDKLTIAYWLVYAEMMIVSYPVQSIGVVLWALLRFVRKPPAGEVLMLVCLIITYLAFSWLIVKGHRYTLYMAIPATFLTVAALRDIANRLLAEPRKAALAAGSVVVVTAVLQSLLASPYAPYRYLAGMDGVVTSLLDEKPEATVLYSGRNDAAFVFYARSLDPERRSSVHRASVQLVDPADLESYLDTEAIDFVVVEIENLGYDSLEIIDLFRDTIVSHMDATTEFELRGEYRLPYGAFEEEGNVILQVFGRSQ